MAHEDDKLPVVPEMAADTTEVKAEGEEEAKNTRERYKASVSRIGAEPMLLIDGVGEFRFAYRNVKKKPGETRPYLAVGDEVECRLTKSDPPKAVSVRVVKKVEAAPAPYVQPPNTFVHNPYCEQPQVKLPEIPAPEVPSFSLYDQLGGTDGIFAAVDDALDDLLDGPLDGPLKEGVCCAAFEAEETCGDSFYPVKPHMANDHLITESCDELAFSRPRCFSAPPQIC